MDVEVFIGDLSDPEFNYENGNYNDNCPKRMIDFFPKSHTFFHEVVDRILKGEMEGKQTDWGTWTASLYPRQIIEFIIEVCTREGINRSSIRGVISFLERLPQDVKVGLVACEMP
jgi:hypothetical protein